MDKICLLPDLKIGITFAISNFCGNAPNLIAEPKHNDRTGDKTSAPRCKKNEGILSGPQALFGLSVLTIL